MQSICEHKDLLKHIGIAQWYNSKLSCEVRFPTPSGHTFLCERNQQSPRACWKKQLRKKILGASFTLERGNKTILPADPVSFRCQNVRESLPGWLRLRSVRTKFAAGSAGARSCRAAVPGAAPQCHLVRARPPGASAALGQPRSGHAAAPKRSRGRLPLDGRVL